MSSTDPRSGHRALRRTLLFLVEPGEDFAQGEPAIGLLADRDVFGPGDDTFYSDLAGSGGLDARMPLGRVQQVRFLENAVLDGGTDLLVWRDVKEHPTGPVACEAPEPVVKTLFPVQPWLHPIAEIEAFDENADRAFISRSAEQETLFPLVTQRVPVSSFSPWDSGWLRMDLMDQSAVMAVLRADGRFSVGISAGQLDDPCAGK